MARTSDILGLNARQQRYLSLNSTRARRYANSKLATKRLMEENEILVPKLYVEFSSMDQVYEFNFGEVKTSFVIKPSGGSGGKGILIVRRRGKEVPIWVGIDGKVLNEDDLRLHISDILEGQYSTFGTRHRAFVEEWVPIHPKFKKYVYKGTPDIRVLVYNQVPVMAMLRLPTEESNGKANLHQGAIGVGVDISTGVTLRGIHRGKRVRYVPGKKRKLNGLKIPLWTSILKVAVQAADVAELKFGAVDLLLHFEKGPMVVELNAHPGLSIQLANKAGLKRRLERVEGLEIRDIDHGVKVGKALFAERFADKVKADEGLVVVGNFETVLVRAADKRKVEVQAKVDTGAFRTSIDKQVASELGLLNEENILWESRIISALGREKRKVIELIFFLKGRRIKTAASVSNRQKVRTKLLVGRRDLQGFLVSPASKRDPYSK